ncbi:MAG: hypothetical protein HY789_15580 [Deltaproteobacteria bacterium]|nr:hypothetical protein [Deltaproteobacteria bacterium]
MKKIISTVAALGLVVGVAGTASALDFTMSGEYVLEGYMLNNADGMDKSLGDEGNTSDGGFDPYNDDAGTDSGWVHTFRIKPQMKVNDKITVVSELRFFKDADWGSGNNFGGSTGLSNDDSNHHLDIYHLYMDYMSPVGKIRAGRVPTGSWGGDFLSTASSGDRLFWFPNFVAEPFTLTLFVQKTQENDWYGSEDDADSDVYEVDLTYKTDDLLLKGAYDYTNNKANSDSGVPTTSYDRQNNLLKAYGVAKVGMFSLEAEWGWMFGDWFDYDQEVIGVTEDRDVDTMAFMLDASTKMDKLNVGLMYFWAEGQDDEILTDADADMTAAMRGTLNDGIGDDFNPYYILTGDHTGMLNSDEYNDDSNMAMSGVNAIGVHADYQVTDQLTMHGAVAYAWADDIDIVEAAAIADSGIAGYDVDDEYGWEVDLGAKYKLLDNLTYEVRAAYFNTGDFFEDISQSVNATNDSDDLYLLSHHLTMTF